VRFSSRNSDSGIRRHEGRRVRIGVGDRADAAQPQLLHERSCRVRCARSTRPLAALEFAQIVSMFSSYIARPKCVTLRLVSWALTLRNTLALSLYSATGLP